MIHSKETRKRPFSKNLPPSKEYTEVIGENSASESHDTTEKDQRDSSEFVTGRGKEARKQAIEWREICEGTDPKSVRILVPCHDEVDAAGESFITELVWNPREKTRPTRTKSYVIKTDRKSGHMLQAGDGRSTAETAEKSNKTAECGETGNMQVSEHGNWKATGETRKVHSVTLGSRHAEDIDESESDSQAARSTPEPNGNISGDEDDFTTETSQKRNNKQRMRGKAQAIQSTSLKKHENLKGIECTPSDQNTENKLPEKDPSSLSNGVIMCHVHSHSDDRTKFCVNHPHVKIYRNGYSKHALDLHFNYDRNTSGGGDNITHLSSMESSQSEDDDTEEALPFSLNPLQGCALEYETCLQNQGFKTTQHAKLFPVASDCNIAQKKCKTNYSEQTFQFPRHASHTDISNLTFSRNTQMGRSMDIYYEVLSSSANTRVERSSEDITDSRLQSLEDVVPELPSRFSGSADRCQRPSLFVPNLFWWRRPSDITELRSQSKHPSIEEGAGRRSVSGDSSRRRYSENVFNKPKKFLTLRFNQLREMWNKRDKTFLQAAKQKAKQNRKESTDSTASIELRENKEAKDFDLQQHTQEKNELIINTLREVVRKCTFIDPVQRPRSHEVYKKLKKLLLD